ncbi:MAG TPA: hypothetical protein ENN17_07725 [bacterium]|nr:hypothetical protein [bacterium]
MFRKIIHDEDGFWSVIFLLLLTTLASLGMATYHATRQSGSNAVNQANVIRSDYAATSGVYYGVRQAMNGRTDTTWTAYDLGIEAEVTNTSIDGSTVEVLATSQVAGTERIIRVEMSLPIDWSRVAIGAGGSVSRFNAYDEDGNKDNSLLQQNAQIPEVDHDALLAMALVQQAATGQTRVYNGGLTIKNKEHFPTPNDFWYAEGVPNVTIIQNGDLRFSNYSVGYGIFIVMEGVVISDVDAELSNLSTVNGVIYSEGDVVSKGSHVFGHDINGAVWAVNDIWATGSPDAGHEVHYVAEYLEAFVDNFVDPGDSTPSIVSWEYL